MKVLVIEDEKKIASFVRKGLEAQGFVVDACHHGDEGYTLATTRPYDVLVLDIMLPGRDGLSILRNLRERKIPVPVILLTARSELNERLEGLNLGADDYLSKPFHIEELIARMHAVTRRAAGASRSILAVADLSMNLLTRKVARGDHAIELTARCFQFHNCSFVQVLLSLIVGRHPVRPLRKNRPSLDKQKTGDWITVCLSWAGRVALLLS